jgi:putative ABC transport system permease protein
VLLLTLRGLRAHKRRMLATILAVVLGVSFMAGARVLTDTMAASLSGVLTDAESGTDVLVRSEPAFDGWNGAVRGPLPAELVLRLEQVDGVAAVAARVEGFAQVLGKDGEPVDELSSGAAPVGQAWTDDQALNPFRLVDGRGPTGEDEIVLDRRTATAAELSVGDRTTVLTREAPRSATVVGIATFGEAESRAGISTVLMPAHVAQSELGEPGTVSAIALRAEDGTEQVTLLAAVQPLLAEGQEAMTGAAYATEAAEKGSTDVEFFTTFITVFAVVSLLVGAFIINNTFAILVAQRVRELALVRALGGSRKQVRRSVALEALVVGLAASALGVAVGVGVAAGLQAMLGAFGVPLPEGPLAVRPGSLLLAFTVGVVITVVSALLPARRAAKVPPVAAMRDVAVERVGTSRRRTALGVVLVALGVTGVVGGILIEQIPPVLAGAFALLIGVATLGPVIASPAVRALGAWLPSARGIRGTLARENAVRNPRRTASTAAALMVGVSLVTAITCFAASGKHSIAGSFEDEFRGDLAVDSGAWMHGGLSADLATALEAVPELSTVAARRLTEAQIDGELTELAGWSRGVAEIFTLEVRDGSAEGLGANGLAVAADIAKDRGWSVGDTVPMVVASGQTRDLTVRAVYEQSDWIGRTFVDRSVLEQLLPQSLDAVVYVKAADGVALAEARQAVERVADPWANATVRDRDQLREYSIAFFDVMLGIVFALLALAVVIALIGIANTLGLSVVERTRELGMLRAVGATRAQVRSAVRWEAALIAAFGSLVGLGVGLFLGWSLVFAISRAVADATFVMPWGQLAVIVAAASACGVLAALLPARRAARLDVLQAVSTA